MINPFSLLIFFFSITFFQSCNEDTKATELINEGNDPNFTIVAHSDNGFLRFNRKVVVFGIDIYAVSSVEDTKLLHAANVMEQYLDNDEDGNINTIYCTYDSDTLGKNPTDGRKVKGVIHFVESSKAVSAEFKIYDRLFLDSNPSQVDDMSSILNPKSLIIKNGYVEPSLQDSEIEKAYQFEREGYFCRDSESDGMVFNKTVGLRDTWSQ